MTALSPNTPFSIGYRGSNPLPATAIPGRLTVGGDGDLHLGLGDGNHLQIGDVTKIDDNVTSTDRTWSSEKITEKLDELECTGEGSIAVKEYNLTSQLDGIKNVFDISPEINADTKISVYYAGQRLVQGVNFSIDYAEHTLTMLSMIPLDSDEGRNLILVAVLTDGTVGTSSAVGTISREPGIDWANDRFFTLVQKNGWAMISSGAAMLGSVTNLTHGMILGNVPEGFRPILHTSCNCVLSNTGQADGSGFVGVTGKRPCELQVHPNGNILLYGFREADYPVGTHFTFQIIYPVA